MNDTHPAAAAVQLRLLRAAGPGRRAHLCRSLSAQVIDLSRAELARKMPGATELEVKLRWVALNYDAALADRVRQYLMDRPAP